MLFLIGNTLCDKEKLKHNIIQPSDQVGWGSEYVIYVKVLVLYLINNCLNIFNMIKNINSPPTLIGAGH